MRVTAVPGWSVRTRAPRERAGYVSLEPWRPPTPGAVSTRGTKKRPTRRVQCPTEGLGSASQPRTCERQEL